LNRVFLTVSLILAGYGQYQFSRDARFAGVLAFAIAMILFAWAIRRVKTPEPATGRWQPISGAGWRRWAGRSLFAASLGCILVSLWQSGTSRGESVGWPFYLTSIALFPLIFLIQEWSPNRDWWAACARWIRQNRWELGALSLILAGSAFLRLYRLDTLPFGVWYDEALNGNWAREVLTQPEFRPVYVPRAYRPLHLLYLFSLSFKWFGVSVFSLRLVPALFGAATVGATWLLGREIGGKWIGLLAAGLIAVSHWCINFSRFGMDGITTPFFAAISVYCLLRGLRSGSRTTLALGGLALGLGLCFYFPFWLFPLVIVVFLAGKLFCERQFVRNGGIHVAVFVLASLLAFAPVGLFGLQHPDRYFSRTGQTSVFAGKTRQAGLEALTSNIRKHLLMFNYAGDRNPRHNLPGEPMLDPLAGALLPLGVALALARLNRPRQLLLVAWVGAMLSAGIFSLDFEAPQAFRTIGTLPVIFLLIAQTAPIIGREIMAPFERYSQRFPRLWPKAVAGLGAAIVIGGFAYSAYLNIDSYFVRRWQDSRVFQGYSTRETVVGRVIAQGMDRYRFYSIYPGHPTVEFLASDGPEHRKFHELHDLPVRGQVEQDVMYLVNPQFGPPLGQFMAWYPGGVWKTYFDQAGESLLYTFEVGQDEVNEMQGTWLKLFGESEDGQTLLLSENRADQLQIQWDAVAGADPVRGEWTGQLFAPGSGMYLFHVESDGPVSFTLEDTTIDLSAGGYAEEEISLTKGWHPVRMAAEAVPGGVVRVEWTKPESERELVPREALSVSPSLRHGLHALYYDALDWTGTPAFERTDWQVDFRWHMQPLRVPFSVEWEGGLIVDTPGSYLLTIHSNSGALLELNDSVVIDSLTPPHGQKEIPIGLEAGVYRLRARYQEANGNSFMHLKWRLPDGQFEAIPAENLVPILPEGDVPAFTLHGAPSSKQTGQPDVTSEPTTPPPAPAVEGASSLPPLAVWGGEGSGDGQFDRPRGIAIGPQGWVYVADAGNGRVQCFESDGTFVRSWSDGAEPFVEPFDIAIDRAGRVYVLDAGRQAISRFSSDGEFQIEFKDLGLVGPRGMGLDEDGVIYVTDTGGSRVLKVSPEGEVLAVLAQSGSEKAQVRQPTDVAVDQIGRVYIVDLLNARIQVLDTEGDYLTEWSIEGANTTDSPHVDIDSKGHLLLTDPEKHQVLVFDAQGNLLGAWGDRGEAPGQFLKTLGIGAGPGDLVAVSDVYNHRVQVFSIAGIVEE